MSIEQRPWGQFEVLLDSDDCKVKRITVDPGKRLSKQYHLHRKEHWTVVSGSGLVTIDGVEMMAKPGMTFTIPTGSIHRVGAFKDGPLTFVEVQLGDSFDEEDIVRLQDDYGRKSDE